MAARALISEREYLATAYQPDCEFEDGVLLERHVGTEKHSWLQMAIGAFIFRRRRRWNVNVYPEQRNLVRPGKYKIPDICVVAGPRPETPIFQVPPLIAIEILSPEDRPVRVDRTIGEWLAFGVAYVWVIDPETLESVLHTAQGRMDVEDATLRVPGTPIEIPLRQLDED
jgi:Uma2 family endonuclease